MARRCEICGKGPQTGFNVSFSHRRTKRGFQPNLQRVRGVLAGRVRRVTVCTSCLAAGRLVRAPRRAHAGASPGAPSGTAGSVRSKRASTSSASST